MISSSCFFSEGGRTPSPRATPGGIGCTLGDAVGSRQVRVGCGFVRISCFARGDSDGRPQIAGASDLCIDNDFDFVGR